MFFAFAFGYFLQMRLLLRRQFKGANCVSLFKRAQATKNRENIKSAILRPAQISPFIGFRSFGCLLVSATQSFGCVCLLVCLFVSFLRPVFGFESSLPVANCGREVRASPERTNKSRARKQSSQNTHRKQTARFMVSIAA